jgi:hypothetical protein
LKVSGRIPQPFLKRIAIVVPDFMREARVGLLGFLLPQKHRFWPRFGHLYMQKGVRILYEPIDFLTEIMV